MVTGRRFENGRQKGKTIMNNQQALNAFVSMYDEDIRYSTASALAKDLDANLEEALLAASEV